MQQALIDWNDHKLFAVYDSIKLLDPADIPVDIPLGFIRETVDSVKALRELCSSDNCWTLQRDSDGIRTLHRHLEDNGVHSIRIEGIVDSPMFDILALLHEVDLFHTWLPSYAFLGLRSAGIIEEPSPVELFARIRVAVPWPFSDREVIFRCVGVDCMGEQCFNPDETVVSKQIAVLFTSCEHSAAPPSADCTLASIKPPSGFLLTPKGEGKTHVVILANIDPQIALVPDWLIDIAVRNLAYLILVAIRKAASHVKGEAYQVRMTDPNNPFFNHIRKRINESMPEEAKYVVPVRISNS